MYFRTSSFEAFVKLHKIINSACKHSSQYFVHFVFRYAELDIADTIKNGLMNKSVLEYPVFHIVFPENTEKYKEEPYLQGMKLSI